MKCAPPLSKLESADPETVSQFYTSSLELVKEFLLNKFSIKEEKCIHLVFTLTFLQGKDKTVFQVIDVAKALFGNEEIYKA
jgi:hypothetical protein